MSAAGALTARERRRLEASSLRGTAVLHELLVELAYVLLPRGMTPKGFSELARFAFVQAATEISKLRNGRVNYSRVAAQTGLSRADVKRLLETGVLELRRNSHAPTRRVIDAWRTDRLFTNRLGRPRRLRITGSNASFASLVKKYGGDVTHRAVLDELRRTGAVIDDGQNVWLKNSPNNLRKRQSFSFLSPVIPVLVDGIRIASKRTGSAVQRLTLPVESEVDLAIVRERCSSSARSMLDGLGQSLGTGVTMPRTKRHPAYSFTITVLLVENGATRQRRSSSKARVTTVRER